MFNNLNFNIEEILLTIPAILIGFSFHEFAHAYASHKFGDPTPGNHGRLTLSPLAHIDIIGFILILLAGFGWAKPVQINPRYYKNPRRDELIVSLVGPFTNLGVAFLSVLVLALVVNLFQSDNLTMHYLLDAIGYIAWINIKLFFFNLVPLPPLDGYAILKWLVPYRYSNIVWYIERYSSLILIIILLTPVVSWVILPPAAYLESFLYGLVGLS